MSTEANRRSSLGMLLRRSKSGELKGKKAQAMREMQLQREREASVTRVAPRLPTLYNGDPAPNLQSSFGEPVPETNGDGYASSNGHATDGHAEYSNGHYTPRQSIEPPRSAANVPVPPVPTGTWVDPFARNESMTHRGRYSYASSAISTINSPRRVRRRKDPTPFNILIVGTRNSGKTSFLEFLKTSLALPAKKRTKTFDADDFVPPAPPSGNFIPHYLETEIDNERIGLTLWDSEGLEKNVVDLQLREMSAFLESKFEDTFTEEMKVVRSPGVKDTHIHAVFLILDPARLDRNIAASKQEHAGHGNDMGFNGGAVQYPQLNVLGGLDEDLDLQVLRTLQGKTTVIPVIAKADTITTKHMNVLKKAVWDSLKKANLDPLAALGVDDLDDSDMSVADSNRIEEESEDEAGLAEANHDTDGTAYSDGEQAGRGDGRDAHMPSSPNSKSSKRPPTTSSRRNRERDTEHLNSPKDDDEVPAIPMSIISPDIYEPGIVGRQFPWGFADPNNEEHCDFLRLKEAVFSEWRGELREASREQWYEGWRTSRLKQRDGGRGAIGSVRR